AFRNQTDPHPNRPKTNVKTYGGWNYSGWLWVSGVYLSWNGGSSSQGGNDGVVNYNSTKRPNAAVILGVKDSRGKVNHSEIATGSKMWQHILPQLPSSLARELDTPMETKRYNPTAIVSSAAEFVSADKGSRSISINAKGKVKISIYQMDEDPTFFLSVKGNVSVGMPERKENNLSFIEAEQDGKVVYTFKSQKPYFVVAETEEKIVATLRSDLNDDKFVYEQGESMNFKIALEGDNIQEVTGSLLRTSNLDGEADETNIASAITFERNGKYFVATQAGNLPTGVYNVAVQVKGEKVNRSIVTSIAVVAAQEKAIVMPKQFAGLGAYPNPSQGATTIHFEIQKKGNNHIRIYNLIGELVYQADLSNLEEGKHQIVWQAESRLKNGIYIYELESNGSKQSKKLVLNR
ncbi:MAG: T9SS type A sorting domain-containing protein, partial [Thermonemataceae bacterium]|nr:T9SS type A sorting domain-containing protein [Thermonemataceae bacterium]